MIKHKHQNLYVDGNIQIIDGRVDEGWVLVNGQNGETFETEMLRVQPDLWDVVDRKITDVIDFSF